MMSLMLWSALPPLALALLLDGLRSIAPVRASIEGNAPRESDAAANGDRR